MPRVGVGGVRRGEAGLVAPTERERIQTVLRWNSVV